MLLQWIDSIIHRCCSIMKEGIALWMSGWMDWPGYRYLRNIAVIQSHDEWVMDGMSGREYEIEGFTYEDELGGDESMWLIIFSGICLRGMVEMKGLFMHGIWMKWVFVWELKFGSVIALLDRKRDKLGGEN